MKKILFSLLTIGIIGSFSFLMTKAYFSDKKTSSGNQFTVGTLNLEVGGVNGSSVEPFVISDLGSGEIQGEKTWKIKNTGTLPGQFSLNLVNVKNLENGCNTPESQVDTSCGDPGVDEGELSNIIKTSFSVLPSTSVVLQPGEETEITMKWFADKEYGNEIQSDSFGFDIDFSLKQLVN